MTKVEAELLALRTTHAETLRNSKLEDTRAKVPNTKARVIVSTVQPDPMIARGQSPTPGLPSQAAAETSGLSPEEVESLEVGSKIEVQNGEGTWTTGEVVKNRTKKHAGQLKVHYDGTKPKKDEWLPHSSGRFGNVVSGI